MNGNANESRNRKYKPGSISQAGGHGRRGTSMHYIARPVKRIDAAAASQGVVVSGVILPETGASFPAAYHICQPVVFVAPFFAESSLLYSTLLYSTLLYSFLFSSGMIRCALLYSALVLVCQVALPRSAPIHCARLEKAADLAFLSFLSEGHNNSTFFRRVDVAARNKTSAAAADQPNRLSDLTHLSKGRSIGCISAAGRKPRETRCH